MNFKKYLKSLAEETTAGDIASIDTKLDLVKRPEKHLMKGKKCKEHKRLNCMVCSEGKWEEDEY